MSNIKLQGNASGSGTVTLQSGNTNTDYTVTLPNTTGTFAVLETAQTFTAQQTFRTANAIRSEAASTQDAVVIAGRAGGTSSYAVTMTPATLSSNSTLTLPNVNDTVAVLGTAQTFTAANTFRTTSGTRFEEASGQDAIVLDGRAGGTSSYAVTFTPTTLSANRTVTLPNADINFATGLGVAQGGTGTTSLTANNVVLGNGTSAVQFVAPGTNGNVLTSNGTTWVSQAASGGTTMPFTAFGSNGGF